METTSHHNMNDIESDTTAQNPIFDTETICALATGTGGALAVIRVSGNDAIPIVDSIFQSQTQKRLSDTPANYIRFGKIVQSDGTIIDETLVSIFRAPHSYTGQDSVELSVHASPYIINQTLKRLCQVGCRMAQPGEFTKRAFLNGKMDLSQAEAVVDLIASSSQAAHDVAIQQLQGHFSDKLHLLTTKLQEMLALLELELDFDEHETIEIADRTEIQALAQQITTHIDSLLSTFETGQALKWGVPVAIVGKTNVGKSSILNRLAHAERAIVSNIHGTTRDTIEETINIQGIPFRFVDTAGLRTTSDEVEKIGIQRTYQAIGKAKIVVYVSDDTITPQEWTELLDYSSEKEIILVRNKADLHPTPLPEQSILSLPLSNGEHRTITQYNISAKENENLAVLEQAILQAAHLSQIDTSQVIVTSTRHRDALIRTYEALARATTLLNHASTGDLIAEELRVAISSLSDITGQTITSDTTLHLIFSKFCVGK